MGHYNSIENWVDDLPKIGKSVFSKETIVKQFPNMSPNAIKISLYRLVKKKKIRSVWRDFYAVILPEYGLKGVPPVMVYIDQLMKHLDKNYYLALLSAAEIHGASHQTPMESYVITNSRILRDKQKGSVKINFITKKRISSNFVTKIMVRSGYVNVSSPELTAVDMLIYEKSVGGINRVATVLYELAENIKLKNITEEFLKSQNTPIIQRLGYLFEFLGYEELSEKLFEKAKKSGLMFRKSPLTTLSKQKNYSACPINEKWKIIINEEIEIDEL